jgi:hypothetical protein
VGWLNPGPEDGSTGGPTHNHWRRSHLTQVEHGRMEEKALPSFLGPCDIFGFLDNPKN